MSEITRMYETGHRELSKKLQGMPASVTDVTLKFPVGPGKMADMRFGQISWFMLMDAIHHRGQFSVYLRMVGARVPAIYGPSLDEPWN
jgi:uncharacterized damage-inducible protein DinB